MGGHALGFEAQRLSAAEYHHMKRDILEFLNKGILKNLAKQVPDSYRSKETFGDLDIVIMMPEYENQYTEIVEDFRKQFQHVNVNGKNLSFGVDRGLIEWYPYDVPFQVDLIFIDYESFRTAREYFGYNDLGNLAGVIANRLGFSYGHEGLFYKVYSEVNPSQFLGKVIVSRNLQEIYSVLGLDVRKRYNDELIDLEDIFELIIGSVYFNRKLYALETRNSKSRVRDRKRSTYVKFLEYIEKLDDDGAINFDESTEKHLKAYAYNRVTNMFPEFSQAVAHLRETSALESIVNPMLSESIKRITGFENKDFGDFKRSVLKAYGAQTFLCNEDLRTHIISNFIERQWKGKN